MKKLFILFVAVALTFTLAACGDNGVELPAPVEDYLLAASPINMDNIDEYLNIPGAKYIDLREYYNRTQDGYVDGFVTIPFFSVLEVTMAQRGTVDGALSWDPANAIINEDFAFENFFGATDTPIFLMCASGGRAGFVKGVLDEMGYTNVYNVGGYSTYAGDHKVMGYATQNIIAQGNYVPGTYFAATEDKTTYVVMVVDQAGYIAGIMVETARVATEMVDDGTGTYVSREIWTSKNILQDHYVLSSKNLWTVQIESLEDYVVANQGLTGITYDETTGDLTDAPDALASITVHVSEYVDLIDELLVEAANDGSFVWDYTMIETGNYIPGEYFHYYGFDYEHAGADSYWTSYMVVDQFGMIAGAFSDLMYHYDADSDGTYTASSKQAIDEEYVLAGGNIWGDELDLFAAYVVENQGFGTATLGIEDDPATTEVDETDTESTDDIVGVTVTVDGAWYTMQACLNDASN